MTKHRPSARRWVASALVAVAVAGGLVAVPAAGAEAATVTVHTSAQLASALKHVRPGGTIRLAPGTYHGRFTASVNGTAAHPITLTGPRSAALTTDSYKKGYGLHVTGDWWRISGLSVRKAAKGIVLDGSSHTRISGVSVSWIGDEGIHVRHSSAFVTVTRTTVSHTGVRKPQFGEGIYVGSAESNWRRIMGSSSRPDRSDHVTLSYNTISFTQAEGIDIKEGTTGGRVLSNRFHSAGTSGKNSADSWIDIKGNRYTVRGNAGSSARLDAIQVHVVRPGWGRGNVIAGGAVISGVRGYEVWVQKGATGTRVLCSSSRAHHGLTNIRCTR